MSFRLYVGNYPSEFNRKDVENMFREFDGIKLEKFFKKEKKCFSFLICKDIEQVVSVIQQMNDTIVSGRQLKVRASDASLQEYVELLLRETGDANSNTNTETEISQATRNDIKTEPSLKTNNGVKTETSLKTNNVVKIETSRDASNGVKTESSPGTRDGTEYPTFVPLQVLRREPAYSGKWKRNSHEQFEINSCHSSSPSSSSNFDEHNYVGTKCYSKNNTSSPNSSYSNKSVLCRHAGNFAEFKWVSVTNFPLGTTVESIYDLFSDYDPITVKMICNRARRDKTLTEAHVCFLTQDIADDVILNFDNTMFQGRLILVNDIEDLTVMNELVNVALL